MDSLVLEPPEPVLGTPLKITITANFDKEVTAMTVKTSVVGLPIPAETDDGCAGIDKDLPLGLGHITAPAPGCPISPGPHETSQTILLSEKFPAIKGSQKTVITDQDGEAVSCTIV